MQSNKIFDIVIFHGPSCPDGICSYYCAKKFIGEKHQGISCRAGEDPKVSDLQCTTLRDDKSSPFVSKTQNGQSKIAERSEMTKSFEPEGKFKGKRIVFVDLCPSLKFIQTTCGIANKITILDHHKTAFDLYQENTAILDSIENLELDIDMERSGCQITWDYFFPGKPRPWFIDYVADRDLWTWKLPNSKEINTALHENDYFNLKYFNKLDELLDENTMESKKKELETEGKLILKIQQREINAGISNAYEAVLKVEAKLYNVWLAGNTSPVLRSEMGNQLIKKKFKDRTKPDFAAIWMYEPSSNEWWISLRGNEESPDLSVICKKLGGGGHRNAAGFTIKNGDSLVDYFVVKEN
jgi:oligoribonuclease NrnB/cAMP/cGMP phosphodiesterase (DHH superfamily)